MKLIGVGIYPCSREEELQSIIDKIESEVKTKYVKVDDLNDPYVVKIEYTETDDSIETLSPEEIHPLDQFELTETINESIRELGIKVADKEITDNKTFEKSINEEAIKKFRELALSKIPKKSKSDSDDKGVVIESDE